MDGDTQARARVLDRRPLIAVAVALAAAAIWAGTSLAGGGSSSPDSPSSPGVSNVDSGGTGAGTKDDCPERGNRSDASADV